MATEEVGKKLSQMEDLDENIIADKPWAQWLLQTATQITRKGVLNWCSFIQKIGDDDMDIDNYCSVYLREVQALQEELILDMEVLHEKYVDRMMQLMQKLEGVCKELQVPMPEFVSKTECRNVPLAQLHQMIRQRFDEYEAVAEIRRRELGELHRKQLDVCTSLGREPKRLPETPLPSAEEIEELRICIERLENEKMDREERFFLLKEEITQMVAELGAPPTLEFEKQVLSSDDSVVLITDANMEELENYHRRLDSQLKTVREEIKELRHRVDDLWNKLETDMAERDDFRQRHTGNSVQTLDALKAEMRRCEALKKANIKVFIDQQRVELSKMWDKCRCTEEDRDAFTYFHSDCYNEDLFELHDREIEKLKAYYEENGDLFKLLVEHGGLWEEQLTLDRNSGGGGTDRYKNRGGQLLAEEKQRNKLSKRLPKVEEALLSASQNYTIRNGRPFLTFGQTVEEYIRKLHEEREKELKLKLSAKKERDKTPVGGARSRLNVFPSTSAFSPRVTPRVCNSKRKMVGTPATAESAKRTKTAVKKRLSGKGKATSEGLPKVNVSHSRSRRDSRRRQRCRLRMSFKSSASDKENNETTSTNYNEFEKEVSTRNDCRSTGFVLKESSNLLAVPLATTPMRPPLCDNFLTPRGIPRTPRNPKPRR